MTAAHQAIEGADRTHEQKRASAPLSTQERNRTGNRILAAAARIARAGGLELADTPEVLAALTALKPAPRKKSTAKKVAAAPIAVPIVSVKEEPAAPEEALKKTGNPTSPFEIPRRAPKGGFHILLSGHPESRMEIVESQAKSHAAACAQKIRD